jgi:hypothetical protein
VPRRSEEDSSKRDAINIVACATYHGVDHVLPEASILQDRLYQLQLLLQQRWLAMYPFEQNTEPHHLLLGMSASSDKHPPPTPFPPFLLGIARIAAVKDMMLTHNQT